MEFPPVLSKADFVRRFAAGEFGNRTQTWETVDAFAKWRYSQGRIGRPVSDRRFHLRNRIPGGSTFYNLTYGECLTRWLWSTRREDWYAAEMVDHSLGTIQGEVYQSTESLSLTYSTVQAPMRTALKKESIQVGGIIAFSLLRYYLCPNSYDWLDVLLQRYPDHVVEFSAFSRTVGVLPNYNTIFWEVRRY